jgi:hypothetical protein
MLLTQLVARRVNYRSDDKLLFLPDHVYAKIDIKIQIIDALNGEEFLQIVDIFDIYLAVLKISVTIL